MNLANYHNYRMRQVELWLEASLYRNGSRLRLPLPRLLREALNRIRGFAPPAPAY